MRKAIPILILFFIVVVSGCKKDKLSPKDLTNITVVRTIEEPNNNTATGENTTVAPRMKPVEEEGANYSRAQRQTRYYIIVASFTRGEKKRAEKLMNDIKAKGYPAEIIDAKGRLRVSIESFSSEQEAKEERDRYRELTDREDIWILGMEN